MTTRVEPIAGPSEAVTLAAPADWQLVTYPGAVHGFTQKMAGDDPSRGAAYHAVADQRSWQDMTAFFEAIFAK